MDPARRGIVEQGRQGCSWPARSSWWIPQGSGWQTRWSHICVQINLEEQRGSETYHATLGLQRREIKPQTTNWKPLGGWSSSRRNSQPRRTVHWREPQGPRMYTNPPTSESAPQSPTLLVGSGESDWKPEQAALFPLRPLPHIQHHSAATCVSHSGDHLRLCPFM